MNHQAQREVYSGRALILKVLGDSLTWNNMLLQGSRKFFQFIKPEIFKLYLFVTFIFILGMAFIVAYAHYNDAIEYAVHSNKIKANLLGNMIQEHQRAALGVIQSYASRPLLMKAAKEKDSKAAIKHLTHLKENNPEIDIVFIAEADGTLWANFPINKDSHGQNFSTSDWYKGVSQEWKPYVSGVFKRIAGEKDLAVVVCAPIFDENGKVVGVIGTSQRTLFLGNFIKANSLSPAEKVILIDQNGQIIYSYKLPPKETIVYPTFQIIKDIMQEGKGDIVVQDPSEGDGTKYVSFTPIKGIGWSVIVEEGRTEILKSEFISFILIGIIGLLLFSLTAFSLFYLRKKYSQMEALQESQKQLKYLNSQLIIAQETERKRIAQDLHDGLQQILAGIKFKVESFLQEIRNSGIKTETKPLEAVIPVIQESVQEIRRIQMNLRPAILDDLGILATISWFCREYAATYPGIHVEKQINIQEDEIPEPLKMVIYRVLQEGLNNVSKHSQASVVTLSFVKEEGRIKLIILDNGLGFDWEQVSSERKGLGLFNMKERVEFSGGVFNIESSKGAGTAIRAAWPI